MFSLPWHGPQLMRTLDIIIKLQFRDNIVCGHCCSRHYFVEPSTNNSSVTPPLNQWPSNDVWLLFNIPSNHFNNTTSSLMKLQVDSMDMSIKCTHIIETHTHEDCALEIIAQFYSCTPLSILWFVWYDVWFVGFSSSTMYCDFRLDWSRENNEFITWTLLTPRHMSHRPSSKYDTEQDRDHWIMLVPEDKSMTSFSFLMEQDNL